MLKNIAMVFCLLTFLACKTRQQQNAETKAIVLGKDKIIMEYIHYDLVVAKQCSDQQLEQYKTQAQKIDSTTRDYDKRTISRVKLLAKSCPDGEEIFFDFHKFIDILEIQIKDRPLHYLANDAKKARETLDANIAQLKSGDIAQDKEKILADLEKTSEILRRVEHASPIGELLSQQLHAEVNKLNAELSKYNESIYIKIWNLTNAGQPVYVVPEDTKLYEVLLNTFKENYDDKQQYQKIYASKNKTLPSSVLQNPLPPPTPIQQRKDVRKNDIFIDFKLSDGTVHTNVLLEPFNKLIMLNDGLYVPMKYDPSQLGDIWTLNGVGANQDFNKELQFILQDLKKVDVSIVQYRMSIAQFAPLWQQKHFNDKLTKIYNELNPKDHFVFVERYWIVVRSITHAMELHLYHNGKPADILKILAQKLPPNRIVNIKSSDSFDIYSAMAGLKNYFKEKAQATK